MVAPPSGARAKRLGAYYTDQRVADFLAKWAIRTPTDAVMDPSFGGGVFLGAALKRSEILGSNCAGQVYGVEIDERVYRQTACELSLLYGTVHHNLICSDFFEVNPRALGPLDAVIGNPPFIRYQRFGGANRQLALSRAEEQGVQLSKLASSWAPFLVHSCAFLGRGGRLGMVVPSELGHAAYARPVLDYLVKNFGRTTLLTFGERLFPELNQDTLLLLAEGKGEPSGKLFHQDLGRVAELEQANKVVGNLAYAGEISAEAIVNGRRTLTSYLIPKDVRTLYERLEGSEQTRRLGELADVGIGYVTGANRFFHLSKEEAKLKGVAPSYLTQTVYRGRALRGLQFSGSDWNEAEEVGEAGYLFRVSSEARLSEPVNAYLAEGERQGIHQAYKCRARSPWYSVPHVYQPDAFLTYMSGLRPLLVSNDAGAVAPNSLHIVRLRPRVSFSPRDLALLWQTSLTSLSAELEGHALGGGMLKLEPREARSVLVASPGSTSTLEAAYQEVDGLLRAGRVQGAREVADRVVLGEFLSLPDEEIWLLRQAADQLRDRRYYRGKKRSST